MDTRIAALSWRYRAERNDDGSVSDRIRELYDRHIRKREEALIDAAAAGAAVGALFASDQVDFSKVTPRMREAFELAYPEMEIESLLARSPEEMQGIISAWKGKLFEVEVRDQLNAGEWVGDIHLGPGQYAQLADSPTQPGWDLQIFNEDGSLAQELQLKATDSLSYLKEALEKFPEIDVLATDEAAQAAGEWTDRISASGLSDHSLEESLAGPLESLIDSPAQEILENVLPVLPFVIIAVGEGRKVMLGRKSFEEGLANGLNRAVKGGVAIGAGGIVALLDGGFLSAPVSILTRLSIDRVQVLGRTQQHVEQRRQMIQGLLPAGHA